MSGLYMCYDPFLISTNLLTSHKFKIKHIIMKSKLNLSQVYDYKSLSRFLNSEYAVLYFYRNNYYFKHPVNVTEHAFQNFTSYPPLDSQTEESCVGEVSCYNPGFPVNKLFAALKKLKEAAEQAQFDAG